MQKVLIYLHLVMCRLALAHFFLGQVVDHQGQQIANQVIVSNFATYLIQNKLQTRRLQNGHTVQFVSVPMIAKPRRSACKIFTINS